MSMPPATPGSPASPTYERIIGVILFFGPAKNEPTPIPPLTPNPPLRTKKAQAVNLTPQLFGLWSHDRATRPAMLGRTPLRFRGRIRKESVAGRRGELESRLSTYKTGCRTTLLTK